MLKIPSLISKVGTMADGGLRIQVDTQEIPAQVKGEVMEYHGKFGYFVFAGEEEQVKEEDIPTEKLEFKGDKSPGQRLRAVLYKLWESSHGGYDEFEAFYRAKMEKIIDSLKERLN